MKREKEGERQLILDLPFPDLSSFLAPLKQAQLSRGIAILQFNHPQETQGCLEKILRFKKPVLLLVLDNGSKDHFRLQNLLFSVKQLSQKEISWGELKVSLELYRAGKHFVLLAKTNKNLGFCGGYNFLFRLADKVGLNYCLMLNNDARLKEEALEKMLQTAQKTSAFAVSPLIWQGERIWYAGGKLLWYGYKYLKRPQKLDEPYETEVHSGAGSLFRVRDFLKVGGLRESLFISLDEPELAWRILKAKGRILVDPSAKITHKVGKTLGRSGNRWHDYFWTRNRLILSFLLNPKPIHWLFVACYFGVKLVKWIYYSLSDQLPRAKIEWQGFRDFFQKNWWAGSLREELNALDFKRGKFLCSLPQE